MVFVRGFSFIFIVVLPFLGFAQSKHGEDVRLTSYNTSRSSAVNELDKIEVPKTDIRKGCQDFPQILATTATLLNDPEIERSGTVNIENRPVRLVCDDPRNLFVTSAKEANFIYAKYFEYAVNALKNFSAEERPSPIERIKIRSLEVIEIDAVVFDITKPQPSIWNQDFDSETNEFKLKISALYRITHVGNGKPQGKFDNPFSSNNTDWFHASFTALDCCLKSPLPDEMAADLRLNQAKRNGNGSFSR